MMTLMPRSKVRRSSVPRSLSCMVSAHPLIAVSGVLSSCDTREMKSFFICSVVCRSFAILLTALQRSPISSSYLCSIFSEAEKSPCAICAAVSLRRRIGLTIERINSSPEMTTSVSMITPIRMIAESASKILLFIGSIDTI